MAKLFYYPCTISYDKTCTFSLILLTGSGQVTCHICASPSSKSDDF